MEYSLAWDAYSSSNFKHSQTCIFINNIITHFLNSYWCYCNYWTLHVSSSTFARPRLNSKFHQCIVGNEGVDSPSPPTLSPSFYAFLSMINFAKQEFWHSMIFGFSLWKNPLPSRLQMTKNDRSKSFFCVQMFFIWNIEMTPLLVNRFRVSNFSASFHFSYILPARNS